MIPATGSVLLGIADPELAQRLVSQLEQCALAGPVISATGFEQLRELSAGRVAPKVVFVDDELLRGTPRVESLRHFTAVASVILLAPPERQSEVLRLVASGELDFVARAGDFVPLAASLVERRLRWAAMSSSLLGPPWAELSGDLREIFRHEINNPLTGILGNAELLLARRAQFSAVDAQRLQTIVDLAVRLREMVRRLSDAWENQPLHAGRQASPAGESRPQSLKSA